MIDPINNSCFETSGCIVNCIWQMATKESTPSPDEKSSPGLAPVDESEVLFDWGPDQDIEQLPGVKDSDEEKDGKEKIHAVSFQKANPPEVPAEEPPTEQGHHSASSSPAEKSLSPASFAQLTSSSAKARAKETKRKQGHKPVLLDLPKFLKRGEQGQPVEPISSTRKSKSPSPSPKSPKSPRSPRSPHALVQQTAIVAGSIVLPNFESTLKAIRYSSSINLATITEQDGLPDEVASCIK